jgi:LacI family transcriptional regulator
MVSVYQIADACGVSQATVSRILRNGPGAERHSEGTRKKVLAMADKLGYRPNVAARAIAGGRFRALALVIGVRRDTSYLPTGLVLGIEAAAQAADCSLSLTRCQKSASGQLPLLLRERAVDGMLLDLTHAVPPTVESAITALGLPAVWLNTHRDTDCVRPDDHAASLAATVRLIAFGHRRIAYLDCSVGPRSQQAHYSHAARREGYQEAMAAAGLPSLLWGYEAPRGVPATQRATYIHRRFGDAAPPTALVCYSRAMVAPAWLAAREHGLRVPQDCSVVSFDELPYTHLGPRVSTWSLPLDTVGCRAGEMLLAKVERPGEHPEIAVPFREEPGETLVAPGGA